MEQHQTYFPAWMMRLINAVFYMVNKSYAGLPECRINVGPAMEIGHRISIDR
jgi:hypothetical protein